MVTIEADRETAGRLASIALGRNGDLMRNVVDVFSSAFSSAREAAVASLPRGPHQSDWCAVCKQGWNAARREKILRDMLHEIAGTEEFYLPNSVAQKIGAALRASGEARP